MQCAVIATPPTTSVKCFDNDARRHGRCLTVHDGEHVIA